MEIRIYTAKALNSKGGGYIVVHPTGPDLSGIDPRTLGEVSYCSSFQAAVSKIEELLTKIKGGEMTTIGKETQQIICGGKYDMEPLRGRPVPLETKPKKEREMRIGDKVQVKDCNISKDAWWIIAGIGTSVVAVELWEVDKKKGEAYDKARDAIDWVFRGYLNNGPSRRWELPLYPIPEDFWGRRLLTIWLPKNRIKVAGEEL